ncbi:Usp domain-containing protein [Chloropicon primus]|uniref:UspA domain-containing protein n=1 Tax=Chloropicon primus TaxID=1764295 RepID=A0A5B8MR25_9CHLO|nr:hypothetical protein A3770_06p42200 [Chloropicon primus]UPR00923.1 Usp domain-containing protein [Chloropicon primus]|eukprot:QDZ21702.1 hypothetical protein A3770_06p42200 [Chloropicon primus]
MMPRDLVSRTSTHGSRLGLADIKEDAESGNRVVCFAVGGSQNLERVIDQAWAWAKTSFVHTSDEIHLVHVQGLVAGLVGNTGNPAALQATPLARNWIPKRILNDLDRYKAHKLVHLHHDGAIAGALCDYAERVGAEAIVIGSRDLTAYHRILLGSVSKAILSRAGCAVAVVRLGPQPTPRQTIRPRHVVIALNDDEASSSVIEAAKCCLLFDDIITLLSITTSAAERGKRRSFLTQHMIGMQKDFQKCQVKVFASAENNTSKTLVDVINGATPKISLVICGSRRSLAKQWLGLGLGSVSEFLVDHVEACGVLVVKKGM